MDIFFQQVVNGLTVGSFYALVALGYTMVYGVIRLINFAHGDLFMVGAFAGLALLSGLGGQFVGAVSPAVLVPLVFLVSMLAVGVAGAVIERLAYRPLRRAPRLSPLITAIGVSLALETIVLLLTQAQYQLFPGILPNMSWTIDNVVINATQVMIVPVTLLLMFALYLFVNRTMIGKAMRAIAIDQDTARMMGINVDTLISVTFFIGGALAAAAGVMYGTYYGSINFDMGFLLGLKAFTAAVLGGIGNIPGAMLGGYVLGLLETLAAGYISSEWKDVIAFGILILVLTVRPTGILGEHVVEKV
jgi:branched-chain amino acid transport system permease protein